MTYSNDEQGRMTGEQGSLQVLMGWYAFQHQDCQAAEPVASALEPGGMAATAGDRLMTMLYWTCTDD
jgi:hypothetical protein